MPQTLPVILSRQEVARLIRAVTNVKHQTALSVAYGAGLRSSEVIALKVGDIDSQRMTLDVDEFMRRFLLHVLPGGFHRIRHYGLLSNGNSTVNLARARDLLGAASSTSEIRAPCADAGREDVEADGAGLNPTFICWHCGAAMIIVQTFARGQSIRAPPPQACTP